MTEDKASTAEAMQSGEDPEPKELSPAWFQWIERRHSGELPQWMLKVQADPCMWEYRPGFWTPGEAWAVIDGEWERVNSGDVGMNARRLTLKMLDALFPNTPPLPAEAFKPRPVTTTFVLWDGDPAVIIKTGAWAKAVRLDAVAGWVTVDPSALWFDEPRNVITQAEDDLPSAFGDKAAAMQLLETERWQELKRPTDRKPWGED